MKFDRRKESVLLSEKDRKELLEAMSELSGWYDDFEESRTIRRMLSMLERHGLYVFNGRESYDLEGCQKSCVYELHLRVDENEFGDGVFWPVENAIFKLTRYWGFPESRRVEIMAYV